MSAVVKAYGGLRPLRIERLTVVAGEHVAVVGLDAPAAEMFTTLTTGAVLPDAGSIAVLGQSTAGIQSSEQWLSLVDRIGLVTSRAALLDAFTTLQNIAMPLTLDLDPLAPEVRERAMALASDVGVPSDDWQRPAGTLDGHLRTRVRLARALVMDPALVVLEHPTAEIERPDVPHFARDVTDLATRRAVAMLTLTADEDFARLVARRVLHWEAASGVMRERRRGWLPWTR